MATRKKGTHHKKTGKKTRRKKAVHHTGSVKTQIDHVIKSLQVIKKHC
ncbi:Uncharacterised protein [uncultured archaeon]|nr:Uncharacterised protein [uncultured archaeon]